MENLLCENRQTQSREKNEAKLSPISAPENSDIPFNFFCVHFIVIIYSHSIK